MGMSSKFEINTLNEVNEKAIYKFISEKNEENDDFFYPLIEQINEALEDEDELSTSTKLYLVPEEEPSWYDYDEEFLELSKHFPDAIFEVYKTDENFEEVCVVYFKNGKKQYEPAVITYGKFDENMLK